jgi:hypothetical protein
LKGNNVGGLQNIAAVNPGAPKTLQLGIFNISQYIAYEWNALISQARVLNYIFNFLKSFFNFTD